MESNQMRKVRHLIVSWAALAHFDLMAAKCFFKKLKLEQQKAWKSVSKGKHLEEQLATNEVNWRQVSDMTEYKNRAS